MWKRWHRKVEAFLVLQMKITPVVAIFMQKDIIVLADGEIFV
jgi:hypothetical protein